VQRTTLYGRTHTVGRRLRSIEEHSPQAHPVELVLGVRK
jgi:hypothetical protein